MLSGKDAFLFFFGIFWATVISVVARYRLFGTNLLFSKHKKRKCHGWRRLLLGLLFMNLAPIALMCFLYLYVMSETSGVWQILSAAVASFSAFGFHRILHAFMLTGDRWKAFYIKREYKKVLEEHGIEGDSNTFMAHFVPGVFYILLPMAICSLLALMPDFGIVF